MLSRHAMAGSGRPVHASSHRFRMSRGDRKSTRLNSSHLVISYAVFCLKKKKNTQSVYVLCLLTYSESISNSTHKSDLRIDILLADPHIHAERTSPHEASACVH